MATSADKSDVKSSITPSIPSARIINVPSPIERFKGRVSSKTLLSHSGPTITRWVEQLENYFRTEHITDDELKISEAKRYIDVTQGDAKDVITLPHIKNIKKWNDFKKELFAIYRTKTEENPFVAWEEFTELAWKPGDSLLHYLTQAEDLAEKVSRSFAIHFNFDLPSVVLKLNMWSKVYSRMPHSKQETILSKININEDVTKQVIEHMKDQLNKTSTTTIKYVPNMKHHVSFNDEIRRNSYNPNQRANQESEFRKFNEGAESKTKYKWNWDDVEKQDKIEEKSLDDGWGLTTTKDEKRCFRCKKLGHIAKYCRSRRNQFFR